jgi:hypothetical protein
MTEAALLLSEAVREPTFTVSTAKLDVISGVRERGLDEDHVQRLVETEGSWPAILVWDTEPVVLDGAHRLAAARRLGLAAIPAVRFYGNRQDAYVEAVRRNVAHGLPLTLKERTTAAERVLTASPEWSDRRVALICGLSAKTVARVRREAAGRGDIARSDIRIGRDGRIRPVESHGVRDRIVSALAEQPNSSLRTIAAQVGASPETVRIVRRDLQAPGPAEAAALVPSPPAPSTPEPLLRILSLVAEPVAERTDWRRDTALSSGPCSEGFLGWFQSNDVGDEWSAHVDAVPLSRVYEIADEARRRARVWQEFADALEGRSRPGRR